MSVPVLEQFLGTLHRLDTRQRAQLIHSMGTAAEVTHDAGLTAVTDVLCALVILVAEVEVEQAEEFQRFAEEHERD